MDFENLFHSFDRKSVIKREEEHPFLSLQREINRLFDGFLQGWKEDRFPNRLGAFNPCIDVTEDDSEVVIAAELPGMTDKDIEVSLSRDTVTIKGEKNDKEERKENFFCMERSFGSFARTIPLPCEIEADKTQARFERGILKITLQKSAPTRRETRKIHVKTE